ncbi:neuroglian-like isoform X1 [Pecten maximus]|uniref:neuroglian-like isoform X1 n=1 Tax=Pecten maximus TaxID=6579 RepID=UPI00145843FA|nr:neuroglian-like isoform X1 [Pecten maximus]
MRSKMWKIVEFWDVLLWSWIFITTLAEVAIQIPPTNKEAIQGDTIKFICKVHPDVHNFHMKWKHNSVLIDMSSNVEKYHEMDSGQTFIIRNVDRYDTGTYTCVATSGNDKDRASATLSIKTTPEPPSRVEIVACSGHMVDLSWEAGDDGGSKIISYLTQFNTSDNPNFWNNYYEEIQGDQTTGIVNLSPWGEYSFRLLARNSIGYSEPSQPTHATCITPPDHPDGNPRNVRTLTHKKKKLIIAWMPMPRLYHNGPGFKYIVSWRPKGSTYWNEKEVRNANAKQLEIDVTDIYGLYEIMVKSGNDIGDSFQPPFIRLGYSGEADPIVSPKDFRLDPTQPIEAHTANFIWESVDTSEEKIRGKFRGYKLRYWKSSEGRHKWKEVDVVVETTEGYQLPDVRAAIDGLPAYTALRAQVAVMNGHYTGMPSQTIDFKTPEGVPGPVRKLHVEKRGKSYILLKWLPPDEPNGILKGYDIGYQPVIGDKYGPVKSLKPQITNPSTLGARIRGLQTNHNYRFYVWARTKTGRGSPVFMEVKTADGSIPVIPNPILSAVESTSINITWTAMVYREKDIQYLLEYRPEGQSDWHSTDTADGRSWKYLNGLLPNTKYDVRLVAMNRVGATKYGKIFSIVTTPKQGGGNDYSYDASNGQLASIHQPGSIASRTQNLAFLLQIVLTLLTFLFVFH